MKVSLALLLDKEKGEIFLREAYDIFIYTDILLGVQTKQNFEKPTGSVLKGIQKPVCFKCAEKKGLNVLSCSQPLAFTFCVSYI